MSELEKIDEATSMPGPGKPDKPAMVATRLDPITLQSLHLLAAFSETTVYDTMRTAVRLGVKELLRAQANLIPEKGA